MVSSLETQLKSDQAVVLQQIKDLGLNNLNASKIAKWLGQWICQGDYQARLAEVNQSFNNAPANNFWAQIGINDTNLIKTAFDSLTETQSASLTQIHQSGASILLGEEVSDLNALSSALGQVTGTSGSNTKPAKGHMLFELSRIYQEVHARLSQDSSNLIEGPKGQNFINPKILEKELAKAINERGQIFSAKFINEAQGQITQLKDDTKDYLAPLTRNNSHTGLIDTLISDQEFSGKTDDELSALIKDKKTAAKEAQSFINTYSQDGIREYSQQDVKESIKEAYANLSEETKAFLVLKAREAKNIQEIKNQKGNSISQLLGKFNLSSLLGTGILGLIAGTVLGNTKLGLLVTGLISFLGSIDSSTPAQKATSEANKKKPPEKKLEPANS